MKTISQLLTTSLLALIAVGCAGPSFNNQIQNDQYDLLSEESFMRYNSNRLSVIDSAKSDFITQALAACHQKKFTKGKDLLESNMQANKTNPLYWNALGTCYALSKDSTKAIFYYDLGLEATRVSNKKIGDSQRKLAEAVISNNLGLIHLSFKRYDEAFEMFKKANAIAPKFSTPEFNIAQLFMEFNENAKALEILKRLEAKNDMDIDVLYSLSLIYFKQNDLDKSFQYVSRIHHDYLNRADIVGLYAYNLMKKKRLFDAQAILQKRLYAPEYDQRNEMILEEVNLQIKELANNPVKK